MGNILNINNNNNNNNNIENNNNENKSTADEYKLTDVPTIVAIHKRFTPLIKKLKVNLNITLLFNHITNY
jgi:hypothetical protein